MWNQIHAAILCCRQRQDDFYFIFQKLFFLLQPLIWFQFQKYFGIYAPSILSTLYIFVVLRVCQIFENVLCFQCDELPVQIPVSAEEDAWIANETKKRTTLVIYSVFKNTKIRTKIFLITFDKDVNEFKFSFLMYL